MATKNIHTFRNAPAPGDLKPLGAAVGDLAELPDIQDLASNVRFSPSTGRIWLYDQRMVLVHDFALADLRYEIIEAIGVERARALFTRIGYYQGANDAALARKIRDPQQLAEVLAAGPQFGAIEGFVAMQPLQLEFDVATGRFQANAPWGESVEAQAHVNRYGIVAYPVCWQLAGYASGYSTEFMAKPILFREVECVGMGHSVCRGIGKPLAEWEGTGADAPFLEIEPFVNAFAALGPRRVSRARGTVPVAPPPEPDSVGMVGASAGFNAALHKLMKVARTDTTVLFLGESGVGKEMFARALHVNSTRGEKPFVAVNCAAIPDELIEAELFGVEKGAYTGALQSRIGRFERADGGTLLLDEVGTLSFAAQGKLLRVLQEGDVERVGDIRARRVDVRVVAATNVDLHAAVKAGLFREDLYFRLHVFPIEIPPLRQRRADIPLLMSFFLNRYRLRFGKNITGFTEAAVDALGAYDWPGNVRELENAIERASVLVPDGDAIDVHHLFTGREQLPAMALKPGASGVLAGVDAGAADAGLGDLCGEVLSQGRTLAEIEDMLIATALARAGGNISAAARALGLSRDQVGYRLRRRGLRPLVTGSER